MRGPSRGGGSRPNSGGSRPNSGGARPNSGGARPGAGRKPTVRLALPEAKRVPALSLQRGIRWYCVETRRGRERLAAGHLQRQGLVICLPEYLRQLPDGTMQRRALFPCYLFMRCDLQSDQWHVAQSTLGVRRILTTPDGWPIPLPVGAIEQLVNEADAGGIVLAEMLPEPASIQPGQLARVLAGPFADLSGLCKRTSGQRVALMLELLGGEVLVELPRTHVAQIPL